MRNLTEANRNNLLPKTIRFVINTLGLKFAGC